MLGSAPTSIRFDKIERFPYFLRSVPSDHYQVQAIIHLLRRMRWYRVAILHDTLLYGKDFTEEFIKQLGQRPAGDEKICIDENIEIAYYESIDWNPILKKLEDAKITVVLLFMDLPTARPFFDAAARRPNWLTGRYQFVGIDAWSNQQDFTNDSKPLIAGAITSEPSSPIWEAFREHIMRLTLNEARNLSKPDFCPVIDNYAPIADNIVKQNNCTHNGISTCTGNETLLEVTDGTLIRSSHIFDNVYIVAKTLAEFCKANTSHSCKEQLDELTGSQFYEMMKANEIHLPDYSFKFWENSGEPYYNYYQYQADGSNYAWKQVGSFYNGTIKLDKDLKPNSDPVNCQEVLYVAK